MSVVSNEIVVGCRPPEEDSNAAIVVYAAPARRNRDANPYNYLLSEALSAEGCKVHELNRKNGIFGRPDVIHIHWPQTQSKGPIGQASKRSAEYIFRLALQRTRGTAVIWTAHNMHAHDQNNPALERLLMWCVTRLVSGVVYLNASSRSKAQATYPALRRKPHVIIPHGAYGALFDSGKDRLGARTQLGIPAKEKVISFVGDILPYKGLDKLLRAVADLEPSEASLLVAGAFKADDSYVRDIREAISRLQTSGHRVVLIERRLTNSEMVDAIKASDIVALPYRRIDNSGLAILAIEQGARLLTTDHELFRELRDELGHDRIVVAVENFSANAIRAALSKTGSEAEQGVDAFIRARSWSLIAAETVAFYRRCGAEPSKSRVTRWHGG